MSNEYLEWLSIHQLPKLRTLVLQQNLSRDDLVDFLTKHNQKVYKTELTEDLLQRINRNFVFDYVKYYVKKLKPKQIQELDLVCNGDDQKTLIQKETGKSRCQLCNQLRNNDRFYTKKVSETTTVNTKKCKDCYIKDHEVRKYKESKNEYLF